MKRWTGTSLQFRGVAGVALVALVLAACSSSTSTSTATLGATGTQAATSTSTPSGTTAPVVTATPTAAASPTGSEATGVPTTLDPCQLVTAQEASQLAGMTFGAGKEGTTSGNGKTCVYGGQTLNVFTVLVAQAPDVATAQAGKAAAQAETQKLGATGIKITELPNLADGAAFLGGSYAVSGQTFNISSIDVLKGTIFFGFSDLALNQPAPTSAAMQAEAQIVLGRLP